MSTCRALWGKERVAVDNEERVVANRCGKDLKTRGLPVTGNCIPRDGEQRTPPQKSYRRWNRRVAAVPINGVAIESEMEI